ncbi:MAG TPA: ImmA/IrrE family metallo-endopeptidase [Thermodesulfobacteriota bacterium]|nr:ImmA/IrrE family metallo-endopeptidase [Thermodesulfobacteriota bacterium]
MISLDIEYLPYEKIGEEAKSFLDEYDPGDTIPVPIEEIIEFGLKINIAPTPNLQQDFDIEGFTSSDFTTIYVDESVYNYRYHRYRFTLAHEVGHIVLHKAVLSQITFDPSDPILSWKNFVEQVDMRDYNKLEFQGYSFAGLVLVPRRRLSAPFFEKLPNISPMIDKAKQSCLTRDQYLDYALDAIASYIAPVFEVSTDVVIKRIQYDRLDQYIP